MTTQTSVAVIGHSHIHALKRGMSPDERFSFVDVTTLKTPWMDSHGTPSPEFLSHCDANSHCVASLGGNFHTVVGLIEHDVRWDFFCDKSTIATADLTRQIIPYHLMHDFFYNSINIVILEAMTNLRKFFKGTMITLSTPPAIFSPEHVNKFPNTFRGKLANGVAPASIRKKLFDLQSGIIAEHCEKIGVIYLPPPPESVDEAGCLLRQYWADDPSHANKEYGALVRAQIGKVIPL